MTTTHSTRTNALTVMAPLRPRRQWSCRVVLPIVRLLALSSSLARLRFIHFAEWIVFGNLPGPRPPGWGPRPRMIFLADYDGDPAEYLAAFGLAVPSGLRWSFGAVEGFPGPRPTRRLIEYVEERQAVNLLRYSAYPDATVRDIDAAFAVVACVGELRRLVDSADDARLAAGYERLLDALALAPQPEVLSPIRGVWRALRTRSTVEGLTVVTPLDPGRGESVAAAVTALAGESPSVFDRVDGVHFCRLARVAPDLLLFSGWFDREPGDPVERLVTGLGDRADAVWTGSVGYPGAASPSALRAWLERHQLPGSLFLGARTGASAAEIRAAVNLRARALDLAAAMEGRPLADVRRELKALWS